WFLSRRDTPVASTGAAIRAYGDASCTESLLPSDKRRGGKHSGKPDVMSAEIPSLDAYALQGAAPYAFALRLLRRTRHGPR
ncbi:MAG: hypothetical protein LAT79_08925, partial [Kiritimatiellae bacterium]|nr:hypothetical protein [Kiritimatiellia bacterium]